MKQKCNALDSFAIRRSNCSNFSAPESGHFSFVSSNIYNAVQHLVDHKEQHNPYSRIRTRTPHPYTDSDHWPQPEKHKHKWTIGRSWPPKGIKTINWFLYLIVEQVRRELWTVGINIHSPCLHTRPDNYEIWGKENLKTPNSKPRDPSPDSRK